MEKNWHDPARTRRQNVRMRHAPLLLLALASCGILAEGSENRGDRLFRTGKFPAALAAYSDAAGGGQGSGDLAEKLRVTRFMAVEDYARDLIHRNRPGQALEVLRTVERMNPGSPLTEELLQRARKKMALQLWEQGDRLMGRDQPAAALKFFTDALAYDPELKAAQTDVLAARHAAQFRTRKGERLFFQALLEREEGHDLRAHSTLTHATGYLEPDSRAGELLTRISSFLAIRSRKQADAYLAAGELGAAWLALREADRLAPGDPEVQALVRQFELKMDTEMRLVKADIAIRSGSLDLARELLARAKSDEGVGFAGEIGDLEDKFTQKEGQLLYTTARASELDGQIMRAIGLYRKILNAKGPAGNQDVFARLGANLERATKAEEAYGKAKEAIVAGDKELARQKLAETIRFARDYEDAEELLAGLQEPPSGEAAPAVPLPEVPKKAQNPRGAEDGKGPGG